MKLFIFETIMYGIGIAGALFVGAIVLTAIVLGYLHVRQALDDLMERAMRDHK